MTLSPSQRSDMYRQIRMVLVRHFIDMGRLTISISMSTVRLTGSLARLPGVAARLTPEIVLAVFAEIRRVPGVHRVEGFFDNWRQNDATGAWIPIDETTARKGPIGSDKPSGQPTVIDIKGSDGTPM